MLSRIQLVTFDCFGTLLDWRQPLLWLDLDPETDYARFESECRDLQHPARPFLSYREVLTEAAARVAPAAARAQRERFAARFGEAPAFLDTSALALIQQIVPIGVLSNCDAMHQLDATRSLGVSWDLTVIAEQIHAYKPHVEAWQRIVARVSESMQIEPEEWLHVSAFDEYDLAMARSMGVRTAFVKRAGIGSDAADADVTVPDLHALAAHLGEALDGPITFEIRACVSDDVTAAKWLDWVRTEQMERLVATGLVRNARLDRASQRDHRIVLGMRRRSDAERFRMMHIDRLDAETRARFGDSVTLRPEVFRAIERRH